MYVIKDDTDNLYLIFFVIYSNLSHYNIAKKDCNIVMLTVLLFQNLKLKVAVVVKEIKDLKVVLARSC